MPLQVASTPQEGYLATSRKCRDNDLVWIGSPQHMAATLSVSNSTIQDRYMITARAEGQADASQKVVDPIPPQESLLPLIENHQLPCQTYHLYFISLPSDLLGKFEHHVLNNSLDNHLLKGRSSIHKSYIIAAKKVNLSIKQSIASQNIAY